MIFQRLFAGLLGLGFVVVGILRFIQMPSVPDLSVAQPVHGILHLASGAMLTASALWDRGSHAEVFNRWNGLFWVVLGLLGLPGVVLYSDNTTHFFVGVASSAMGWISPWSTVWQRQSPAFRRRVGELFTGLLSLGFLGAGGMKLMGPPSMVAEFASIGVGQWLRFATGGLELGAAIGLFAPPLRRWAALGLAAIAAGATAINLAVLHRSALVPALLLVLALVVLGTHFTNESAPIRPARA